MEPDIVIIGAGAAGIAAARRLASSNLKILLLEALPRLGGRAWTVDAAGHPADLGCGYLHSAERNPWAEIAEQAGVVVQRDNPAWDQQYRNLGAPAAEWQAAGEAFDRWSERLVADPPASDIAADALEPGSPYTPYIQAISGYINGDELERLSVRDYVAYDQASTFNNWRLPGGYGALITSSLPAGVAFRLGTSVTRIDVAGKTLAIETAAGTLHPRAAIITVSTSVLAGGSIAWPAALDPWRGAAARLPLGNDEKLLFEIIGSNPFEDETHVLGDLYDPTTGSFYIRPFGRPLIEVFLGGAGARAAAKTGHDAAFARALDQLAGLFGADIRKNLRPVAASDWTNTAAIGGAYSHALPGQADYRARLAQSFENRLFFAGEATHPWDFSTAHGAYFTGIRAAEEALEMFEKL